ncbi:MAG TPA: hypothetical protein VK157_11415, partial [Phycisphaerales bacterium]|nr:hypothetical protein [Phycisphaerales bacterium]
AWLVFIGWIVTRNPTLADQTHAAPIPRQTAKSQAPSARIRASRANNTPQTARQNKFFTKLAGINATW